MFALHQQGLLPPDLEASSQQQQEEDKMDRKKQILRWWGRRAWMGGRWNNSSKKANNAPSVEATASSSSNTTASTANANAASAPCNKHLARHLVESIKENLRDESSSLSPGGSSASSTASFETPASTNAAAESPFESTTASTTNYAAASTTSDDGSIPGGILQRKRTRKTHPDALPNDNDNVSLHKTRRSIRFADEEGKPMATVRYSEKCEERHNWVRFIVLMVAPSKKKFEFVHVYFKVGDVNLVSDVLRHIREISTHRILAKQKYVGLVRLSDGGSEMLNCNALQDYNLERHEVIAAIPKGMKAAELIPVANHIVQINRKLLKIMKRTPWEKKRIPKHRKKKKKVVDGESAISLDELNKSLPDDDLNELSAAALAENVPKMVQAGAFLLPIVATTRVTTSPTQSPTKTISSARDICDLLEQSSTGSSTP